MADICEEELSGEVTPRYIGEKLVDAISAIKYVYDVPKNCIKVSEAMHKECFICNLICV